MDLMQSKIMESHQKEKNSNFNYYLDKSIDLITEFNAPNIGVLACKDAQNSSSKKNDSILLNIDKNHLPVSPTTYLRKWDSDVKRKITHQKRISE